MPCVLVTARLPEDGLALALEARRPRWAEAGLEEVTVIGDALAPATIAHATYAGRRYAEECDAPTAAKRRYRRFGAKLPSSCRSKACRNRPKRSILPLYHPRWP